MEGRVNIMFKTLLDFLLMVHIYIYTCTRVCVCVCVCMYMCMYIYKEPLESETGE